MKTAQLQTRKYIPPSPPRCGRERSTAPERAPATAHCQGGSRNREAAVRPAAGIRASSYPKALSWDLLSPPCPPLPAQIHPKQKAILGSNFYVGVQVIKGLWIYPASHLRTKGRTQRRPSPGTRQKSCSRALCSGCFIQETCLNQRLKNKNK